MHEIHFYKNSKGERPVADYIKELASRHDKDSRIKPARELEQARPELADLKERGLDDE